MDVRNASVLMGLALGATTSVALLALMALGHVVLGTPFVAFDVFEALTRILPGALITKSIDAMVSVVTALHLPTAATAKMAEMSIAIATFVIGSAVIGAAVALLLRRASMIASGVIAAAVWMAIAAATEHAFGAGWIWLGATLLAWGLSLAWVLDRSRLEHAPSVADRRARRRFLEAIAAVVATSSTGLLALAALVRKPRAAAVTTTAAEIPQQASMMPNRALVVAGTRAEITPNERFYRIDIDLEPPDVDAATWRLHVDGLVASVRDFTLDEIRAMPAVSQLITLECISNRVAGDLISTSEWTGVRLRDFLRTIGASDRARAIHLDAADGYHESVPIEEANDERTLLVHTMNGVPLAREHGFPLRIYIPDHFGMKQPKWITKMTVSDHERPGYWVERGWSKRAPVQTTSVIDVISAPATVNGAKVVPIGGIAFSGARGISRVEVQVDDDPWAAATLISPPLSPLSWVLWRYDWPYRAGTHTFRVRAYDGAGTLQPTRERPPHPDGATGIHTRTMRV